MTTIASPSDYVVHQPRIRLAVQARASYLALAALDDSVELDGQLRALVKIRVAQLHSCAFGLDMHLHDARGQGISHQRLDTLAAWRESPFFTARERAALALTEAVTLLQDGMVPDAVYDEAARHFEPDELAQVIFAIVVTNAWNRVAVTSRTPLPTRE